MEVDHWMRLIEDSMSEVLRAHQNQLPASSSSPSSTPHTNPRHLVGMWNSFTLFSLQSNYHVLRHKEYLILRVATCINYHFIYIVHSPEYEGIHGGHEYGVRNAEGERIPKFGNAVSFVVSILCL